MRQIYITEQLEEIEFAKRAAKCFEENPEYWTFTDGDVKEGELFAVKWGLGKDCVLVFRIDDEEPRLYAHVINTKSE